MKILLFTLLGLIPFQAPPAGIAGTWVAEHAGTTFIRLELNVTNQTLAGAIGTGNLSVDNTGNVIEVTAVPAALTPLYEIVVKGSTITFMRPEGTEAEQFRLNVLDADRADLTFLPSEDLLEELKEAGIAAPKPIRLHKIR